ncbi:GntR family transcriptional regulator [Mesoplasma syrphidae]|uniref:GntR family transcriptional regulator n=1 Tax=Mesoplasma syrphidae TaxID=225999 RepID=A0A2K9C2L5_9MOLU|nr:GntR family transcriptional regulator [Mesoplasma syrphidae]AUF83719.1 GntR family transcriptional regulator [Mesoplasma syrphidae]
MEKKWKIVFDYLLNIIKSNEIQDGGLLPSQNRLKTRFKYSEQPIRIAFNKLIELKLVESVPGKGFVVTNKTKSNQLFSFRELFPNSYSEFYDLEEVYVDKELSAQSGFYPGATVYKFKCKRYIEDKIKVYQESWLNKSIFKNVDLRYLKDFGLMEYVDKKTSVKVSHCLKNIYVQKSTPQLNLKLAFEDNEADQAIVDRGLLFDIYNEIIEFRLSYYKMNDFSWEFIEWRS